LRDHILDNLLGAPEQKEVAFDSLMPNRVSNLLLVTSLYDSHTFIEDGRLSEMLYSEYLEMNLRFVPSVERVSTAQEALTRIGEEHYDLVISMPRVGEMNVRDFGRSVAERSPGLPVMLLASNARELSVLKPLEGAPGIDRVFVWLGDVRLFLAMIKLAEDRWNAWHDARAAGVKSLLLLEDSAQFYSSYLPMLYTELMKQTQALMADSVTRMERIVRQRARPKILLATTYEEGERLAAEYRADLLGVILDASFPRGGRLDRGAGVAFARMVRESMPQVPVLMQSGSRNREAAASAGVAFIDKNSPRLLAELRSFMQDQLGFGEFVFRRLDGSVVMRAPDLRSLEWAMHAAPPESLLYHADRHDLSTWLMARTEFELAESLRPVTSEWGDAEAIRQAVLKILKDHRDRQRAGVVAEFHSVSFEGGSGFVRIGTGSLGGKGRGLAFVNSLIETYKIRDRFPDVRIFVPPTAVLATGVFDQFMEASGLQAFALKEQDDEAITRAFLAADFPKEVVDNLWSFLDWVRYPLAVRSSSLLEDASYQPFAGIYETYMIPNNHEDPEVRLAELLGAVKRVYASTYHSDAKAYIESTPNRLEEEKMAVVIQQVVGRRHEHYVYPDFAGVARSLNFYPMPGMKPEDGVASVALGLGKTVVDGGRCARFCPAHPKRPLQSFSPEDTLENAQRSFYALDLAQTDPLRREEGVKQVGVVSLDLDAARRHGTLAPVASVYSPDNDAVYDGLGREGIPLVTMAGVLKGRVMPLPEVLAFLLKVGSAASSCPVEMEFAVTLPDEPEKPSEFGFLQIRPLVLGTDAQDIPLEAIRPEGALCVAHKALGNGLLEGIRDVVYVRPQGFDRGKTPTVALHIGQVNARLKQEKRPYLLVGPGRWGSADPWLGIPVKWAQIAGVRCIVETDLEDIRVDSSQGSHFFQNIMSFGIGYLTVDTRAAADRLDYGWLDAQPADAETDFVRHVALQAPVLVALNGRHGLGVIMKPGRSLSGD
jgi:CheY-like chemotaxis protein